MFGQLFFVLIETHSENAGERTSLIIPQICFSLFTETKQESTKTFLNSFHFFSSGRSMSCSSEPRPRTVYLPPLRFGVKNFLDLLNTNVLHWGKLGQINRNSNAPTEEDDSSKRTWRPEQHFRSQTWGSYRAGHEAQPGSAPQKTTRETLASCGPTSCRQRPQRKSQEVPSSTVAWNNGVSKADWVHKASFTLDTFWSF